MRTARCACVVVFSTLVAVEAAAQAPHGTTEAGRTAKPTICVPLNLLHREVSSSVLLKPLPIDEQLVAAGRLVERYPENAEAHALLGATYLQVGKTREGVAALQNAVAKDPNDTCVYESLSAAYIGDGRLDDAVTALDNGLKIRRDHHLLDNLRIACAEMEKSGRSNSVCLREFGTGRSGR